MRHKPELTPTARLILNTLSQAREPLSISNLCDKTGGSPYTVNLTTRRLVRQCRVRIIPMSGIPHFVIPSAVVVL